MRFWLRTAILLAVMFAGLEVASRLFIGRIPELRVDPRFGKITVPDAPIVQSFEGFSNGRTNELGNLDAAMPATPPSDGIMVLGDSYTEARHVSQDDRYTDRLGVLAGRRVYNVGHAGWSPVNALAYLESELPKFRPATVVVQVSGNDLADLVAKKRARVVDRDGTLAIEFPTVKASGGARAVIARSAFAGQLISSTAGLFGGKSDDDGNAAESCAAPSPLVFRAVPWILAQLARAHPDVRIVYLPKLDYHAGCSDECATARGLFQYAAERVGVRFIDPTAAMCARFAATRQPLHGFWNTVPGTGHMNADGHAVVAEALAASLRR
jgi:lysophospholipase L1-like esterase